MKIQYVIAFGICATAVGTALAELELGDASKLPPVAAKTGVTYEKDIKALFDRSCVKCHGGEKPKAKYNMETLAGVLKGGSEGASIVPGNSAKSALVHQAADLVADMEMPPTDKRDKYPALTKAEIGLVRAWIDQGAK
jgi:mono/diheme cytochrome c family protein